MNWESKYDDPVWWANREAFLRKRALERWERNRPARAGFLAWIRNRMGRSGD